MTNRRVFCAGCEEAERLATANHSAMFCAQCSRVCFPGKELTRAQKAERAEAALLRIDRPTAIESESVASSAVVAFVADVLAWDARKARLEPHEPSITASALRAAELGIVGNGCSSTLGGRVGGVPVSEGPRIGTSAVADGDAKYSGLDDEHKATVHAVTEDGHGLVECSVVLAPSIPPKTLSLATRVGLRLAPPGQRRTWLRKILERDSRGVFLGAHELGMKRLEAAARAWFASLDERRSVA